ncbi:hypothetical protein [Sideroxydans sp.]
MVMAVILVLGVSAALVGTLSNAGLKIKRDEKTTLALAQAKEALIGQSILYSDYPGSLPCPDTDNDGESDAGGSGNCPQYIGRLPWKTLGLSDLRDATGERLWYTLSSNVRRYDSVMPLNSNTEGTLDIDGGNTNLMAIVFAPGAPVSSQTRGDISTACTSPASSDPKCIPSNYLEGSNGNASLGSSPNTTYQSSASSPDFNDQLITISHDQLFTRVEQRVGGEFRRHLNNYYSSWGAYPFAAPFSTANYKGAVSTYEGLYPFGNLNGIGSSPPNPEWSSSPITISFSSGSTPIFDCERRDSDWNNSRVRCTADASYATLPAGATVTMTAKLQNVGRGFWQMFSLDINNNGIYDSNEQVRVRDRYGNYQLAKTIFDPDSISVSGTLNYSDGSATVVFSAKGKSGGSQFQRIDMRNIQYESGTLANWIQNNQWQQLLYYAVSQGNAPAGSGGGSITCTTTSGAYQCLTLSGAHSGNDRKAVIIMTGSALSGQSRSSTSALCSATGTYIQTAACISNYLESENSSTGDKTFENQPASTSFNDQVIVVAP